MSTININKIFLIFPLFLLYSCNSLDAFKKKEVVETNYNDKFEYIDKIAKSQNYENLEIIDSYKEFYLNNLDLDKKINNVFKKNTFKNKYNDQHPIRVFILDKKLYSIDFKSNLSSYDIENFNLISNIKLDVKNVDIIPSSMAIYNKNIFISYSNGELYSFDIKGNILWQLSFKDLLKTPIKIYDESLIVLLSSSIMSVDIFTGEVNWDFSYKNNAVLQSDGGNINNVNNILFFKLPNGSLGQIDTVFGEKNLSIFDNLISSNNANLKNTKLHSHQNLVSYLDSNNNLSTFDILDNTISLNSKKIKNISSSFFFKNSLFIIHKNKKIRVYNIKNLNTFFILDITKLINFNEQIINIINKDNNMLIFFKSGLIVEVNNMNGDFIKSNNLNVSNIRDLYTIDNLIFVSQENGYTSIYTQ